MTDDAELLRCYADDNSQVAFTELVHRHVDLVYHAALRRAGGDRHLAEDAAQRVFSTLARDARKLSRHAVLSAWLHTATRNAALNLMISEQRRKKRERAAVEIQTNDPTTPEWERLRPVLDSAIDELGEPDRAAVVLRFLERRAFAEIATILRVSEDAARMRTERALEKLRLALERRGITSTGAALAAIVSSQPLASAPAGLAATLAQTALATAGAGAGVGAVIASLVTSKSLALVLVSGVVAFVAGGYLGINHATEAALPAASTLSLHEQEIARLRRDFAELRANRDALSAENTRLTNEVRSARAAQKSPVAPIATPAPSDPDTGVVQRAMINNLRQLHAARQQFYLENKRPANSLDELVGERKYIKRLNAVDGEDYSFLPLHPDGPLTVVTRRGTSVTYDPAGHQTTALPPAVPPSLQKALAAYAAAHGGQLPPTIQAVLPYFATVQEGADFVEALEAQKAGHPQAKSIPTGIEVRR